MGEGREQLILKVAEEMIRQGGYNSFSFRNIAAEIGIKSSSVHYHYSTKEDLAVAVTKYYTDQFISALGSPKDIVSSGKNPVSQYVQAFRQALVKDKGMCLCGMLGAETDILPESVIAETRVFFQRNVDWLETAYQTSGEIDGAKEKAIQTVSLLEGAMITSNVMGDLSFFDAAVKLLNKS